MKSVFSFLSFAAVLAVAASPAARADGFDSSLTQGPGVYFGNGNANSNLNVVTSGNVQLGLGANVRFVAPIVPNGNVYTYTPGGTGTSNWDFIFSVNTGSLTLSSFTYSINILDTTTGNHFLFDPTLIPDNGQANGSDVKCTGCTYNGANTGFQNAENLGFFPFNVLLPFDPNAPDNYTITLSATPTGTTKQSGVTDTIYLAPAATPEPSSIVLMGTGLLAAAGAARRKFKI